MYLTLLRILSALLFSAIHITMSMSVVKRMSSIIDTLTSDKHILLNSKVYRIPIFDNEPSIRPLMRQGFLVSNINNKMASIYVFDKCKNLKILQRSVCS